MKKIILPIVLVLLSQYSYSQSPEAEIKAINSRLVSGSLTGDKASLLLKKWNAFTARVKYPEIKVDTVTKEIDFSAVLLFDKYDKKILYQRCLQWMAINYFTLSYSDFESGKLIGNGFMTISHQEEFPVGFVNSEVRQTQTSTNYTLILTFKDNKIKYWIQDISYTFINFSEFIDETTLPISSLFPIVNQEQRQWVKFVTLLHQTRDKFSNTLKNSMIDYVNDFGNDYNF